MAVGRIPLWLAVAGLGVLLLGRGATAAAGARQESYAGRSLIVYVPDRLPPAGQRALVVVLHGGMGNAAGIERTLALDPVAERDGFIVAYLNGTRVARYMRSIREGWNAGGGCCGLPAKHDIDDVGYIKGAIGYLTREYGIDPGRIYGVGHSNGAMMTQRIMCQTGIYAAAVPISGPLNLQGAECAAARGKRILAIHGARDENVPIAGGRGTKGLSRAVYRSEDRSRESFLKSGASYRLLIVHDADHRLPDVESALKRQTGSSLAETIAQFFGLASASH